MEKCAVTAVCWVPRGKCKARLVDVEEDANVENEAQEEEPAAGSSSQAQQFEGLEEFNLDKYDDDDDNEEGGGPQLLSHLKADADLATEYDPYLKGDPNSDSGSEESYEINQEDNVFVAVSCEEDTCALELYVYDEEDQSTSVHHDIPLDAYPLCVEWLSSTKSTNEGNFAVIGAINSTIHIWNLDQRDPTDPCQQLGTAKGKTKKKKAVRGGRKAHDGAVLCLHGSLFNRSVLASGSADHTVKVWDVSQNSCVHTYGHHTNKVQCCRWHPTEQAVLLSAAFDRNLALLDARQPGQAALAQLPAEAESAIWSQHKPFECFASVDNGFVVCYDVRKVANKASIEEQVVWQLHAHDLACTSVQDSPIKNMLITVGLDCHAKVWNTASGGPQMVHSKDLKAGPLFSCQSNIEDPKFVVFGGNQPVLWDLSSESVLTNTFPDLGEVAAA